MTSTMTSTVAKQQWQSALRGQALLETKVEETRVEETRVEIGSDGMVR